MFSADEQPEVLNAPWVKAALTSLDERGVHLSGVMHSDDPDVADDFLVTLHAVGLSRRYRVEVKARVQSSRLAAPRGHATDPTLLVTQHMPRGLARACRDLGIHFVDSAGNMFLDWGHLLIDVEGRKAPEADDTSGRPLRSFGRQGLTVVFALLCGRGTVGSLRDISTFSGSSLGTVQTVMKELSGLGFVEPGRGESRLHRTQDLLNRWTDAYQNSLGPTLARGGYQVDGPLESLRSSLDPEPFGALWGGEAAAAALDGYLRPETLTVYAPDTPVRLLAAMRARRSSDSPARLFVRRQFWTAAAPERPITPTPLVYADLVASQEARQLAAAARLREADDHLRYLDSH